MLEKILQNYFGLKGNAFLEKPYVKDNWGTKETMTKKGNEAYNKMIKCICEISDMGVDGIDLGTLIDSLDEITNGIGE